MTQYTLSFADGTEERLGIETALLWFGENWESVLAGMESEDSAVVTSFLGNDGWVEVLNWD